MGKRSDFKRRANDFYQTPRAAVEPLLPHLPERFTYIEPCAGDGALIRALSSFEGVSHDGRFCPLLEYGSDIAIPDQLWASEVQSIRNSSSGREDFRASKIVFHQDALEIKKDNVEPRVDFFVTNPPWSRPTLHALIMHLSAIRPTWLLFDADWAHTKQAAPYLAHCRKIVSVGRCKWIPGSPHTSKDSCSWYLFDHPDGTETRKPTEFWGRTTDTNGVG
jgi:hypothetical protein|tara:strand:+ start:3630 stop:4289 length:660 start_codon:yes stop_codon:yes gene_type:complete